MIQATALIVLFWLHTFADFALQSDKMAINKSSTWEHRK